jgi:hypothetical protein
MPSSPRYCRPPQQTTVATTPRFRPITTAPTGAKSDCHSHLGLLRRLRPVPSPQQATCLPTADPAGRREGDSKRFPCSPSDGRRGTRPAFPCSLVTGTPQPFPATPKRQRCWPTSGTHRRGIAGEGLLLPGPHPPDSSRWARLRGFHHWFLHPYAFSSRLPDPSRLAVPARPVVVEAACHPSLRSQGQAASSFTDLL